MAQPTKKQKKQLYAQSDVKNCVSGPFWTKKKVKKQKSKKTKECAKNAAKKLSKASIASWNRNNYNQNDLCLDR